MNRAIDQVVAVVGPTASGKSGFAVHLAMTLDGEVVSGDSMQIYKGMNIGTAKITEEEKKGIAHHLLDLRSPRERFSAADYQMLARQAIGLIFRRGKTPIVAGGTGLYIDSALYNYEYTAETEDAARGGANPGALRTALIAQAREGGAEALWEKLKEADPESAGRLHPHDLKRIVRALEYAQIHQEPISRNQAARQTPALLYPTIWIGLNLPRSELYARIDRRVDLMMDAGLLSEAADLFRNGLDPDSQAGKAIGYRQMFQYFNGECTFDEAVEAVKQESRRYAKRQLTWFRRNRSVVWLDARKAFDAGFVERLAARLRAGGDAGGGGFSTFIRDAGYASPE